MIRNKLAVLMAERGLKITRVAKDTGISRNTITSIAQNDSEMIRLETINILCKYLSITPCEFFEFEPIDFTFDTYVTDFYFGINKPNWLLMVKKMDIDLIIDANENNRTQGYDLDCKLSGEVTIDLSGSKNSTPFEFIIEFENEEKENDFFNNVYKKINPTFYGSIYQKILDALSNEVKRVIKEETDTRLDKVTDFFILEARDVCLSSDLKIILRSNIFRAF